MKLRVLAGHGLLPRTERCQSTDNTLATIHRCGCREKYIAHQHRENPCFGPTNGSIRHILGVWAGSHKHLSNHNAQSCSTRTLVRRTITHSDVTLVAKPKHSRPHCTHASILATAAPHTQSQHTTRHSNAGRGLAARRPSPHRTHTHVRALAPCHTAQPRWQGPHRTEAWPPQPPSRAHSCHATRHGAGAAPCTGLATAAPLTRALVPRHTPRRRGRAAHRPGHRSPPRALASRHTPQSRGQGPSGGAEGTQQIGQRSHRGPCTVAETNHVRTQCKHRA